MVRAAGISLRHARDRWRFVFVVLEDDRLHRIDRFVADSVWQEAMTIALSDVGLLCIGGADPPGNPLAERLIDEAWRVATAAGLTPGAFEAEAAYANLRSALGNPGDPLPPRDTLDGFQARIELLHMVGLRPARITGGVGLLEPNDVLDATVLAWHAAQVSP